MSQLQEKQSAQHTPGPVWEMGSYSGGREILKEAGPMGRFLFDIEERPGLGIDATRIRATMVAAPEMLAALEAQEEASAFATRVSAATPDGQSVAKHLMDKADLLFARAERLRRAAIAKVRGEG